MGWVGTKGQINAFLDQQNADRDPETGAYHVSGEIAVFMGIDVGPETELVLDDNVLYYKDGKPLPLDQELARAGYGMHVYVIM